MSSSVRLSIRFFRRAFRAHWADLLWRVRKSAPLDLISFGNFARHYPSLATSIAWIRFELRSQAVKPPVVKRSFDEWSELGYLWRRALELGWRGYYRKSVALRARVLNAVDSNLQKAAGEHWPSLMTPFFAQHIGHLGYLALFCKAQDVGLIASGRRVLPLVDVVNYSAIQPFSSRFSFSHQGKGTIGGWIADSLVSNSSRKSATPLWPYLEQMEMFRTREGPQDIYQLWEIIHRKDPSRSFANLSVTTSEPYESYCWDRLETLGLQAGEAFVALHIRQIPDSNYDHRAVQFDSYLPAVKLLLDEGYKVVRFGSSHMRPMPQREGIIDLVGSVPGDSSLDYHVLQESRFLLSTTSGPAALAMAIGRPVLWTNATTIGKATLTGPPGTRYLPKRVFHKSGRELSLSEILQSNIAYWEGSGFEGSEDLFTTPNSGEEILAATAEMVSSIEGKWSGNPSHEKEIEQIRLEANAVSFGKIVESFTQDREHWMN
jgi:putative glycosyltransferase (TIGR04372 family)